MKDRDVRELADGLYVLKFGARWGGGTVLAAVGSLWNSGMKWYASCDRKENARTAGNVVETSWECIERATLIRTIAMQQSISFAQQMVGSDEMDPELMKVVRDAFLAGNDREGIAIIATQLGLARCEGAPLVVLQTVLSKLPDGGGG